LLDSNPDSTPQQIAQAVKEGKINITADLSSARSSGTVGGKVAVGMAEIQNLAPMVLAASAKVSRGQFVPLNKLVQLGESSISDPNLKVLKGRITAILNAYDLVAGRGGTDEAKRAEVRQMILSSDSPEALQASVNNLLMEANVSEQAAQRAMYSAGRPATGGTPPPAAPPAAGKSYKHPSGATVTILPPGQ
jgi:hypothetical protein